MKTTFKPFDTKDPRTEAFRLHLIKDANLIFGPSPDEVGLIWLLIGYIAQLEERIIRLEGEAPRPLPPEEPYAPTGPR